MKIIFFSTTTLFIAIAFFAKAILTANNRTDYSTQDTLTASIARGEAVYNDFCIQCHLSKGEGIPGTFPPLAKSNWLTPERYKEAISVVKYGQQGEITVNGKIYNGIMANLGLYDNEVADVMNYIMNNWGNSQEEIITEDLVKSISK